MVNHGVEIELRIVASLLLWDAHKIHGKALNRGGLLEVVEILIEKQAGDVPVEFYEGLELSQLPAFELGRVRVIRVEPNVFVSHGHLQAKDFEFVSGWSNGRIIDMAGLRSSASVILT
jgi:hypothetical protein